ncbi:metal-dependent hydrolase [Paenibacillus sp. FSL H8-0548]|uniref:metal-dependent hydrolase n=1 Tax=Paenibacillus sp. FSL H8-0548 TaxID=1920422 RepID=UPI00096D3FB3|nr:metal-dependent hydrolase [Paenibacillus sp. FSL H8-0548]OMF27580.1 metal-dependent hydrolase [Paenibacillus sp. FSL H8-0548]
MTGKSHLIIGAAVGAAASIYYPFTLEHAALYIAVAGFSALCADLDGPSMLSSKLTKLSKLIREFTLWSGVLLAGIICLYFFTEQSPSPLYIGVAAAFFLLGLVAKQGVIRNVLASAVGGIVMYAGYYYHMNWLIGFGLFSVWAPWLKHRGMTHTIWVVPIWGAIGLGLENQLQIEGISIVSMLGYLSHLIADTLTPSGVKWLYPLTKKSFKIRL